MTTNQHVYEHPLFPGEVVTNPEGLLRIYHDDQLLGTYGFYRLSRQDLEDAVMLRATQLLSCSCVNDQLQDVWARAETRDRYAEFSYNPAKISFMTT